MFKASVTFIFRIPDGSMRETGETIIFEDDTPQAAMLNAYKWGENILAKKKRWNELLSEDEDHVIQEDWKEVGSVKLYKFQPQRIAEDGSIPDSNMGQLGEWKCDYPGTIDQWLPRDLEAEKLEAEFMSAESKHMGKGE